MAYTKVILLARVAKLGPKYTVKNVSSGYARNFLFPQGKATLATAKELARFEMLKEKEEKTKTIKYELFKKAILEFEKLVLVLKAETNEEGHLYGAIHAQEITEALKKDHGFDIDSTWLVLKTPIKEVGEYMIEIVPSLETNKEKGEKKIKAEIKVKVEAK